MFCSINQHYKIVNEVPASENGLYPPRYTIEAIDTGAQSLVAQDLVRKTFCSAQEYTEEREATRTEVVALLRNNHHTAMTLTFTKNPQIDLVAAKLQALAALPNNRAEARKLAKELLTGEKRELSGYFIEDNEEQGRLTCFDYVAKGIRAVDPRTISTLILKNVLYKVS